MARLATTLALWGRYMSTAQTVPATYASCKATPQPPALTGMGSPRLVSQMILNTPEATIMCWLVIPETLDIEHYVGHLLCQGTAMPQQLSSADVVNSCTGTQVTRLDPPPALRASWRACADGRLAAGTIRPSALLLSPLNDSRSAH